jgi:hypothetical protein
MTGSNHLQRKRIRGGRGCGILYWGVIGFRIDSVSITIVLCESIFLKLHKHSVCIIVHTVLQHTEWCEHV